MTSSSDPTQSHGAADALDLDPETARLVEADADARGDRKPSSDAVDVERAERARATEPETRR